MLVEAVVGGGLLFGSAGAYQRRRARRNARALVVSSQGAKPMGIFGAHRRQLEALQGGGTPSEEERAIHRKLVIFSGSLGSAVAGVMVAPIFSLIGLPLLLYLLKDVYRGGLRSIVQKRRINVDSLVALLCTLFIVQGLLLYCNFLVALYLINRKLLARLRHSSGNSIVDVFSQRPRSVWVLVDGTEMEIPFTAVQTGDTVVVGAGETVPVDGVVSAGFASVDQHLLTGESQPLDKAPGDPVFASTTVLTGRVQVRVERAGEETTAAHIGQILNQTIGHKTSAQLWTERTTDRLVLPTLMLAGVAWPLLGATSAMVVLNSHFRYRLNIVTATGALNFLNLAARRGILFKDARTLERLADVDTLVFDKTGTLTEEQPEVVDIHVFNHAGDPQHVLTYAAAVERRQSHPIACAILHEATARGLSLPTIDETAYHAGYGLLAEMAGRTVRVGSLRFAEMAGCEIPDQAHAAAAKVQAQAHSLVFVALDDQVVGAIELRPRVRPEGREVLAQLRAMGIRETYIISGDHEAPTRHLARDLGVTHYFAETLPERKGEIIDQLQREGRTVCYVGDGINDAIALKKAAVSVSLRGASTAAIDTAQVVLMDGTLRHFGDLFETARAYRANMRVSFTAVTAPCALSLCGALVPGFGVAHSFGLAAVSVFAGFGSSAWPLVREEWGGRDGPPRRRAST